MEKNASTQNGPNPFKVKDQGKRPKLSHTLLAYLHLFYNPKSVIQQPTSHNY
jgi:hypothetical protein